VESTLRSLNNLLERFHQSFFLYLMTTPSSFLSVGNYLPAPLLVSAAFTLAGLEKWTRTWLLPGRRPVLQAISFMVVCHVVGAIQFFVLSRFSTVNVRVISHATRIKPPLCHSSFRAWLTPRNGSPSFSVSRF
jgi:Gaa1-like, GPI transamidase component